MDSALPHAKLMYAPVLKWSDWFTEVYCPYCNKVHVHEGTKPEDVHQWRRPICQTKCRSPLLEEMGIRYQLKYPFDSYEIDKSNTYHQCFINSDRDVRIPDSERQNRWITRAPSYDIQSNPYAYEIQGEFPHEVVAPTDIDQVTDGLANLTISSGSNLPSIGNQDAPRSIVSPVIHIREISGLLDEAGHVRGCVGEISICLEWEQNSDTDIATLQISVLSCEPGDVKIYYIFFGTLQPGNMYLGHKIDKDSIRKRLKEVRFYLLSRNFVSLADLVTVITPVLKAVPVFGNDKYVDKYVTCLEGLLHREQPHPSTLPLFVTLASPYPLYWHLYPGDGGFVHAGLVRQNPFPTIIKNWRLENQWKTIAWMRRKGNFHAVYAISGYGSSPLLNEPMPISGADYSLLMIEVLHELGYIFPADPRKDGGVPGRFHASHAEMQLAAYLVYHHRPDVGFRNKLESIAPSGHLESAVIGVSKKPCYVCARALQEVCIAYKFRITVEFVEDNKPRALDYPE